MYVVLSGIVFMGVEGSGDKMPPLVKYKIRMDLEDGPIMSQIVPRFPTEGKQQSFLSCCNVEK